MNNELLQRVQKYPIFLDGTSHVLELDPEELQRFYIPLAVEILKHCSQLKRLIVAVAGPPGCGKTAFAATLTAVLNNLKEEELAVTVGLDGWHLPNAQLAALTVQKDGRAVLLSQIKGAPETYDHEAIGSFLNRVSIYDSLRFPVYSREKHDPVPDDGEIRKNHRIIILEGNYWLLDEPPWTSFQHFFSFRIFLTASPAKLVEGLRSRHLRGGKSVEWIEGHIQRVDLANIEYVAAHSIDADVIVEKSDSRYIRSLKWCVSQQ